MQALMHHQLHSQIAECHISNSSVIVDTSCTPRNILAYSSYINYKAVRSSYITQVMEQIFKMRNIQGCIQDYLWEGELWKLYGMEQA